MTEGRQMLSKTGKRNIYGARNNAFIRNWDKFNKINLGYCDWVASIVDNKTPIGIINPLFRKLFEKNLICINHLRFSTIQFKSGMI